MFFQVIIIFWIDFFFCLQIDHGYRNASIELKHISHQAINDIFMVGFCYLDSYSLPVLCRLSGDIFFLILL